MKIFISWSGNRSAYIAESLYWWLPNVLQTLKPFVSKQDIDKGARGELVIGNELADTNVGVVCLTPENLQKPWILFEAGALSKTASSYLCTFIHELTPAQIERPLGAFQHTKNEKEDIRKLCVTLNKLLAPNNLELSRLNETFDLWYPKLEEKLGRMPPADEAAPPKRTLEDMVAELLNNQRESSRPKYVKRVRPAYQNLIAHDFVADDGLMRVINRQLPNLPLSAVSEFSKFLRWIGEEQGTLPLREAKEHPGFKIAFDLGAVGERRLPDGSQVVELAQGLPHDTDWIRLDM